MRLFVSALEYSANIHLKYLLREMIKSENIELCGIFDESVIGEINRELVESKNTLKGTALCNINSVAVMGFIDVIKRARFFLELRKKCVNLALSADKILLMDSSSFNIPLAKRVKKRDSRKEIMYYILPQVWAWKPWRAKVIEANCDKLAAILPFEVECYRQKAKFVGHPLLDEIKAFRSGNLENSSLGMQFRTCGNFGDFADSKSSLNPQNSHKYKSHTANTRIMDSNIANSSESNELSLRENERSEFSWQSNQNQSRDSATLKASSGAGVGVVREGEGSDFAIQAPTPSLKENAREKKRDSNADLSAKSCKGIDCFGQSPRNDDNFLDSSRCRAHNDESFVDCHELLRDSRNDESTHDSTTPNLAMTENCVDCFGESMDSPRNDKSLNCHESTQGADSHNDKSTKIFTFMPGSRLSEINRIFPIFLQVKDELKKCDSKAQFNLVVPKKFELKNLSEIYGDTSDFHITFDTHTSLLQSTFAFICSGTATLECALIGTPFVLGYQGRWIEAFVVKQFLNIRFVGLANLLYSHIAPNSQFHTELLQENLNAKNLLDSYHNANPNDFLAKSLALRAYLKNGSARAVAQWLLEK